MMDSPTYIYIYMYISIYIYLIVYVCVPIHRERHLKHYRVLAITLHYVFASLYNALTLWRNVTASISYRSEHIGSVIASCTYRYKLIDQFRLLTTFSYLDIIIYTYTD